MSVDLQKNTTIDWDSLYEAACTARDQSYSPYSRFKVGAALLTAEGDVVVGCNVENRSYGLTICAERTALVQMVAGGQREVVAVAVVTETSPPATPCGMCRESLTEFAGDIPVLTANLRGERKIYRLRELHPSPFEWAGPPG